MFCDVLYVFVNVLIVYSFQIGGGCLFCKNVIITSVVLPGMTEICFAFRFSKVKNAKNGTVVANFLIQGMISYFGK